jgi:hypothetical protein
MALLPKAGIGKFLALKSRWNCARLFISARPLSSARKGDFAHCSVVRGARSVPPCFRRALAARSLLSHTAGGGGPHPQLSSLGLRRG